MSNCRCLTINRVLTQQENSRGSWMYIVRCLDCGFDVGSWIPYRNVRYEDCIDYDYVFFDQIRSNHYQKIKAERKDNYNNYLQSAEWAKKRMGAMDRDNWKCVFCGDDAVHVHHMTYERIFNEALEDLVSLCERCHQREHSHGR